MRRIRTGSLILLLALPATVLAVDWPTALLPENMGANCNVVTGDMTWECIPLLITNVLQFFFMAIGTFCLAQIIYAGYQIALGSVVGGLSDQGKTRLRNAIVGLLVSIFAFAIVNIFINAATGG